MTLRFCASTLVLVSLAFTSFACSSEDGESNRFANGGGNGNGNGSGSTGSLGSGSSGSLGSGSTGSNPNDTCGKVLPVLYRDFKGFGEAGGHPDFEAAGGTCRYGRQEAHVQAFRHGSRLHGGE